MRRFYRHHRWARTAQWLFLAAFLTLAATAGFQFFGQSRLAGMIGRMFLVVHVPIALVLVIYAAWKQRLLRRLMKQELSAPTGYCRECGYDLRGLEAGEHVRCPECGTRAHPREPQ